MTDSSSKPAEGEVAELTRADVLHWLQQDRSWGVLIAPTEWRAIDEEWLDLIYRAALARWGRPAQPAPPAEGEVAELARWLRLRNPIDMEGEPDDCTYFKLTRAAELLAQAYPPAPVPVSERLPQPEDCDAEGRVWLWGKVGGDWRLINPANSGVPRLQYCFSHWLPAHALPLPAPQGGEVEP